MFFEHAKKRQKLESFWKTRGGKKGERIRKKKK